MSGALWLVGALTLVYSVARVYLDVVGVDGGKEPFHLSHVCQAPAFWFYLFVRGTANTVTVYLAWWLLAAKINNELIRLEVTVPGASTSRPVRRLQRLGAQGVTADGYALGAVGVA
jgi:hypothetical protein